MTLAYAQSLDGCIAAARGRRLALSGTAAQVLTHRLRAMHDAILVGVGTVIADDPRLDVRLVTGPSPQPVVLDSRLRIPVTAQLLTHSALPPWIAALGAVGSLAARFIECRGGRVLAARSSAEGRVDLAHVLDLLSSLGIRSVMVEGGAAVIRSFLESRLVDHVVVSLTPRFVGGLPAVDAGKPFGVMPELREWWCERVGADVVIAGDVGWQA